VIYSHNALYYARCITTACQITQARKVLLEYLYQLVPDGATNFGSAFEEVIDGNIHRSICQAMLLNDLMPALWKCFD
jgi:hypothetical protein